MIAWLAKLVRQVFCAHLWVYDATVLRSSRDMVAVRHRCERCGAKSITHQNAELTHDGQ